MRWPALWAKEIIISWQSSNYPTFYSTRPIKWLECFMTQKYKNKKKLSSWKSGKIIFCDTCTYYNKRIQELLRKQISKNSDWTSIGRTQPDLGKTYLIGPDFTWCLIGPDFTWCLISPYFTWYLIGPDFTWCLIGPDFTWCLIGSDFTWCLIGPDFTWCWWRKI